MKAWLFTFPYLYQIECYCFKLCQIDKHIVKILLLFPILWLIVEPNTFLPYLVIFSCLYFVYLSDKVSFFLLISKAFGIIRLSRFLRVTEHHEAQQKLFSSSTKMRQSLQQSSHCSEVIPGLQWWHPGLPSWNKTCQLGSCQLRTLDASILSTCWVYM